MIVAVVMVVVMIKVEVQAVVIAIGSIYEYNQTIYTIINTLKHQSLT